MDKEERKVIDAAITWYREALRTREKLDPIETKLFYAVATLENAKSIKIPTEELYEEERSTTPAPSYIIDALIIDSKKESNGD